MKIKSNLFRDEGSMGKIVKRECQTLRVPYRYVGWRFKIRAKFSSLISEIFNREKLTWVICLKLEIVLVLSPRVRQPRLNRDFNTRKLISTV